MRIIVFFLIALCGCAPSPRGMFTEAMTGVEVASRSAVDYDRIADEIRGVEAEAAKTVAVAKADAAARLEAAKASIGRAAAMEYVAGAATWTRRLSYATIGLAAVGLIVGAFFGGVGRRGCLFALAVGGAGVWVGYFITAHGYFVSEFISWCLIVVVVLLIPAGMFIVVRGQWEAHVSRRIAAKRAEVKDGGRDAIRGLAVPQKIKRALDDAWEMRRSLGGDVVARSEAKALLGKFGLADPAKGAL